MWFKISNLSVELNIYVKPNAKKTAFLGIKDSELHLSIHAKPKDGAANKELICFLSEFFKIPKTQITLLRGKTSRHKQLRVPLSSTLNNFLKNPLCSME